jgi:hypothetical protein
MWVGVQDENAPAPDRTLLAFSLPAALAGADPRQPSLDIPVAPSADDQHTLDWLALYQVERLLAAGNLAEAHKQLLSLLDKYPTSEYLLLLMGKTCIRRGDLAVAAQYFESLTKLSEVANLRYLQEAIYYLGLLADHKGDRAEALKWYRRSLEVDVPDVGGNDNIRRQALKGLIKRLSPAESWPMSWWRAIVFQGEAKEHLVPSGRVAAISILGAHRTNTDWITRWLGVKIGDQVTADEVAVMRRSLKNLQTFDDVKVTTVPLDEENVHLVIRLQEGFGFFKDPVEFGVNTIVGLSQHSLSLRYDNLAGRGINIGGTYSWDKSRQRLVFAEAPLNLAGANSLRLQALFRSSSFLAAFGRYAGTREAIDLQSYNVTLCRVLTPLWTMTVQGRITNRQITSGQYAAGYVPTAGRFVSAAANFSRSAGSKAKANIFSIEPGVLGAPAAPGHDELYFPRLGAAFSVKRAINYNTQIALYSNTGWMSPGTPLVEQFWLGGNRTLRGYATTIPTTAYAHATLECRRYVRSDLHAALVVDAGLFADDSHKSGTRSLWTPGASIRYDTPTGSSVHLTTAYAPERSDWRYQFQFTTTW